MGKQHNLSPDTLIDIKYMIADMKYTKQYFYSKMKAKENPLPRPIKIGRTSRWKLSVYEAWKDAISVQPKL